MHSHQQPKIKHPGQVMLLPPAEPLRGLPPLPTANKIPLGLVSAPTSPPISHQKVLPPLFPATLTLFLFLNNEICLAPGLRTGCSLCPTHPYHKPRTMGSFLSLPPGVSFPEWPSLTTRQRHPPHPHGHTLFLLLSCGLADVGCFLKWLLVCCQRPPLD